MDRTASPTPRRSARRRHVEAGVALALAFALACCVVAKSVHSLPQRIAVDLGRETDRGSPLFEVLVEDGAAPHLPGERFEAMADRRRGDTSWPPARLLAVREPTVADWIIVGLATWTRIDRRRHLRIRGVYALDPAPGGAGSDDARTRYTLQPGTGWW